MSAVRVPCTLFKVLLLFNCTVCCLQCCCGAGEMFNDDLGGSVFLEHVLKIVNQSKQFIRFEFTVNINLCAKRSCICQFMCKTAKSCKDRFDGHASVSHTCQLSRFCRDSPDF